jgi:hypothetical protein
LLLSLLVNIAKVKSKDIKKRAKAIRIKREVKEGAIEVNCALLRDLVIKEF